MKGHRSAVGLNYIRTGRDATGRATLNAKRQVLEVAAIFAGHSTYQELIDEFLGRVEWHTLEILDAHPETRVQLRRLVENAVEAEITQVLKRIDSAATRRLSGSRSE